MTCGVDLIRVLVKESFSGFDYFLRHYGSQIASSADISDYNKKIKFNVEGVGYEAIVSSAHRTINLVFGGLRDYRHDSRSERRWSLLQKIYAEYPQLKITELHFAFDIPYWFNDLKVEPKRYTNPYKKSSLFFDKRREKIVTPKRLRTDDDIIIYDKSWKCGLATPVTRVELRLRQEQLATITKEDCIIRDHDSQKRLLAIIERKMTPLKIRKSRSGIRFKDCPSEKAMAVAMQYIQGDGSLLPLLLEHRTEQILQSSKLFDAYVRRCCKTGLHRKNQIPAEMKATMQTSEYIDLIRTLKNFKPYDMSIKCSGERKMPKRKRLTADDKQKIEEMSFLGLTMSDIAEELGVSESTISRVLRNRGIRRVKIVGFSAMLGRFDL